MTATPNGEGEAGEEVMTVEVVAVETDWIRFAVEVVYRESPVYEATTAWDPADIAVGGGVHWAVAVEPLAGTRVTPLQPEMVAPLSVKATGPVGVVPEPLVGATVAV